MSNNVLIPDWGNVLSGNKDLTATAIQTFGRTRLFPSGCSFQVGDQVYTLEVDQGHYAMESLRLVPRDSALRFSVASVLYLSMPLSDWDTVLSRYPRWELEYIDLARASGYDSPLPLMHNGFVVDNVKDLSLDVELVCVSQRLENFRKDREALVCVTASDIKKATALDALIAFEQRRLGCLAKNKRSFLIDKRAKSLLPSNFDAGDTESMPVGFTGPVSVLGGVLTVEGWLTRFAEFCERFGHRDDLAFVFPALSCGALETRLASVISELRSKLFVGELSVFLSTLFLDWDSLDPDSQKICSSKVFDLVKSLYTPEGLFCKGAKVDVSGLSSNPAPAVVARVSPEPQMALNLESKSEDFVGFDRISMMLKDLTDEQKAREFDRFLNYLKSFSSGGKVLKETGFPLTFNCALESNMQQVQREAMVKGFDTTESVMGFIRDSLVVNIVGFECLSVPVGFTGSKEFYFLDTPPFKVEK